jgi:molecular chaperone DnaK
VRKTLAEQGEQIAADARQQVEAALRELDDALKGDDHAQIDAKINALSSAAQRLGEREASGAQQQAYQQGPGNESPQRQQDDVMDAEFKEVDDRRP